MSPRAPRGGRFLASRQRAIWSIFAGCVLAFYWGAVLVRAGVPMEGDTVALIGGARAAVGCLRAHEFYCEGVTQFPLLQLAPVGILTALEQSDARIVSVLAGVSVFSVAVVVLITGLVGRKVGGSIGAMVGAVLVLASPLAFYSATTWGEPLAAGLMCVAVASVIFRWHPLVIALAFFAATLTKDTSAVTLILLATALLVPRMRDGWTPVRREVVAVLMGSAIGVLFVVLSNLFRWKTLSNSLYVELPRPETGQALSTLGALWASPSGGILPYWPLMTVLVLLLGLSAVNVVRIREWPQRIARASLLLSVAFNTALLATFAAPFGWVAWGPRLAISWVVASALAAAVVERRAVGRACSWFARYPLIPGIGILMAALYAAAVNVAARESSRWLTFFEPNPANPYCARVVYISEPEVYFPCINSLLWDRWGPLQYAWEDASLTQTSAPYVLGVAVMIVVVLITEWRATAAARRFRR